MERPSIQVSLTGMLGLVACVALNLWLFRLGPLLGILGLNVTKHVVIAYLCQVLGVNRRNGPKQPATPPLALAPVVLSAGDEPAPLAP